MPRKVKSPADSFDRPSRLLTRNERRLQTIQDSYPEHEDDAPHGVGPEDGFDLRTLGNAAIRMEDSEIDLIRTMDREGSLRSQITQRTGRSPGVIKQVIYGKDQYRDAGSVKARRPTPLGGRPAKFHKTTVREIRQHYIDGHEMGECALAFDCSFVTISKIIHGDRPYDWCDEDQEPHLFPATGFAHRPEHLAHIKR